MTLISLLATLHAEPLRFIGVSLVTPSGTDASLVASTGQGEPVLFVDDGSVAMDHAGDGEYWALVRAEGSSTQVAIQGMADGRPVSTSVEVATPTTWDSPVHVVTWRLEDGALTRVLTAPMRPPPQDTTGGGAAGLAVEGGWSAAGLALIWGAFLLTLVVTGVVRASILEARQGDGTR